MRSIGIVVAGHLAAGVVENGRVVGDVRADASESLMGHPAEDLVRTAATQVQLLAAGEPVEAVGCAFPGIIRDGVIEESPNLPQLKGLQIEAAMCRALAERKIDTRVSIFNDADVVAAGLAATHGQLDLRIRVWTLGHGVGFGTYPPGDGVWEGGHTVVSLDPNERFCGCGGRGHLEGIMGHRAMRLRFLDREPEDVFASARGGEDPACAEFVLLWHRALAAATATSIHLQGAGKFYITGINARFVNLQFLNRCIQEMVKMSPLQGYTLEVIEKSDEIAVLGAAINAQRLGALTRA